MKKTVVNLGSSVACDMCNKDWTRSDVSGGFLFSSYAVCPDCAEEQLKSIKSFNEEKYITKYCPKDKSFADWVREDLRGGKPGQIITTSF